MRLDAYSSSVMALTVVKPLLRSHFISGLSSSRTYWNTALPLTASRENFGVLDCGKRAGYGRRGLVVKAQAGAGVAAAALVAVIMGAQLRKARDLEVLGGAGAGVRAKLTELEKPYKPYPLLTNRHVETIFAAFFRSLPKLTFRRECLRMPDGGTVALDWPQPELPNPKAVLVLLVCCPSPFELRKYHPVVVSNSPIVHLSRTLISISFKYLKLVAGSRMGMLQGLNYHLLYFGNEGSAVGSQV